MLIKCKNVSVLPLHHDVQSTMMVLLSHRSMASAIPNSLNSMLSLVIQQFINSWLMYGSVLCLSKTASKTPLTRLTLHRGRTTQRNVLSYHLNCPDGHSTTYRLFHTRRPCAPKLQWSYIVLVLAIRTYLFYTEHKWRQPVHIDIGSLYRYYRYYRITQCWQNYRPEHHPSSNWHPMKLAEGSHTLVFSSFANVISDIILNNL